jgi:hypothetical protein
MNSPGVKIKDKGTSTVTSRRDLWKHNERSDEVGVTRSGQNLRAHTSLVTFLFFNKAGSLSQRNHKDRDGSEWSLIYIDDQNDRLAAVQTTNADQTNNSRKYEHDEYGRLTRILETSHTGEIVAESWTYDTNGRKYRTINLRSDPKIAVDIEGG